MSVHSDDDEVGEVNSSQWIRFQLSDATLNGIQSMGFVRPTKIQEKVLPLAIEQRLDIMGVAETGSGKTLAFILPIVERWLAALADSSHEHGQLFALIITPTRELAVQIQKELERLTAFTDEPSRLRSVLICGGINQQKQERLLKRRPDVIVATPGRLWSLIEMGDPHVDDLSSVRMLVVDEVDRMLEKGHFQELSHVVTRIHANINGTVDEEKIGQCDVLQTLVFSATLTFAHAPVRRADGSTAARRTASMKIDALVDFLKLRDKRAIVDVTARAAARPAGLVECRMHCVDLAHKDANLYYLLNRYGGRTLVFTNSVDATKRLYNLLNTLRFQPAPKILHAKMQEQKRLKNLEKFAETENAVLLATDVASRGLDIRGVQNVIHYQMPRTSELYVHRSGRTARAERVGLSILFVDSTDVQNYIRIKKNLEWENDLEILSVDQHKLMEACQRRIEIATKFESAEFALKKASCRNEWFKRLADEADLILDDDLNEKDDENGGDESPIVRELRMKRKALEKALNATLRQPLPIINTKHSTSTAQKTNSATNATQPKISNLAKGKKKENSSELQAVIAGKGRIIAADDVENLIDTNQLRERLNLEKKPVKSLKRHFKKRAKRRR